MPASWRAFAILRRIGAIPQRKLEYEMAHKPISTARLARKPKYQLLIPTPHSQRLSYNRKPFSTALI
jgi:hypothetical protein